MTKAARKTLVKRAYRLFVDGLADVLDGKPV
jgi:hypothetical protein